MNPTIHALKLRPTLRILAFLFVLTGAAGLLAEQCFEKLLTSLLGASTPAAAVVLSVYFLGLTLGAWTFGRRFAGRVHPLKAYALLEGGVAVWALLLFLAEPWLVKGLTPLLRLGLNHFALLQSLRFLAACIWILPPTLLMGASFPAIVDVLERLRVPRPRKAMTGFYALNLLGAVLGALMGPYLAFPEWGLGGTLLFTAFIDGTAGATGWMLAGRLPLLSKAARASEDEGAQALTLNARTRFLLALGFASGFLFFGLEVLWTHLVSAVSGNSVYAFASMLALVLIGLGIGGWISARIAAGDRPLPSWSVGALLLAGSLMLLVQFRTWPGVPSTYILWGQGLRQFEDGEILRWIQGARLLLPSAIVLGMVYPALFRLEAFPSHERARMASLLGAWNSLGCVLGALLTGFWLLPKFGSEHTLLLFGEILILFGLVLVGWFARGTARGVLMTGGVVLAALWGTGESWDRLRLTNGGHVYFHAGHVDPSSKLLFFHEDTLGGITTVVERPVPGGRTMKTLLTNGKFQANDTGEVHAQTAFALLPILNTRRFDDALVIGLGSGHSAEVVGAFGFPRVDIAEISPGIVEAARKHFSHINGSILDRPGVTLRLEDGRNHLLLTDRQYDLITMEISSVWFAGSTSLYCEEFYEVAKARLKPGGVFQQWIQVHHLSAIELGSVLSTLRRVFPHVSFWWVGGQGILLASDQPLEIQPEAVRRFYAVNPWSDPKGQAQDERLKGLLSSRVLGPQDFNRLLMLMEFPINTDRNRFLEYATPKYNLSAEPFEARNLAFLAKFSEFKAPPMATGMPQETLALCASVTPDAIRQFLGVTDATRQPAPEPNAANGSKAEQKKIVAAPTTPSHP